MSNLINRFKRMFIVGFQQIQDPYYHGFAAQISFYLMLSVVPILILIIQLLGLIGISMETALNVVEQYTGNRISNVLSIIFEFSSIGFGNIIFLIIALWAGSRASFAISRIANYTMTEGRNTGKNYFIERARAIVTMLLTMISLVVAIVILCYGKIILIGALTALRIDDTSFVDSFWLWLRWPLAFVLYFFIIGYNFYILPTVRKPFKTVIPGALFASIGMLIVSWVYTFYTSSLVNYDIMYGALSSVVALMIWFLLLSWVLILGLMCNKVVEDTSHPYSKREVPEELEEIRWFKQRNYGHVSKFDMAPEDVNISTIKDILKGGQEAVEQNTSESTEEAARKPINKQ
ncbi:MAG: YihY/virulence factor BrkB family protein [Clostridia bacterium]|nr:YihY/virulence factor BrkB family protein [Bacillota bacterium]MCR5034707.1 YihY/virulence factor BrkB family protein [Clostridia bacterium]